MHFGLIPVNIGVQDPAHMIGMAQHAEELGFESVWTFEHVIVPIDYASKYPYNASGKMGAEPTTNFVDPLIALSALASATSRLRFGTGVNILSQANPLYVAKQAASLDFISGGRFMLGVGIGWLREEFEALGVPFERRGARFDDYISAMRKVWSGDVVEHEGEFVKWSGFQSYPIPRNLPVVMGGNKGKIFERIAKYGDGWFAPSTSSGELAPQMEQLRAACAQHDRDPADIEVTCMWTGRGGADAVAEFAATGVSRLLIPAQVLGADPRAGMEKIAAELIDG